MAEMFNYKRHGNKKQVETPDTFNTWKTDQKPESFNKIMDDLEPTINKGLGAFGKNDPSLNSQAYILAARAVRSYDPERGASLNTHVYNNLKRLNRISSERSRAIHIPENQRVDHANISNYSAEYRDRHGHDPSLAQLSNNLEMSRKRIQRALNIAQQSESQSLTEKGDLTAKYQRTPDQIWADYVYHDLDETNKKIFEWTTGHNGSKTLPKGEIAKRLKISGPAVSKRVNKILKQLDEGLSDDVRNAY
jgi:DNA-directed RNA polymerase specialized sigma subunit